MTKASSTNPNLSGKPLASDTRFRLLTRDEVEDLFGLSKRWLEVAATRGEGPPIVRISPRMVRYRVSDIEAWIEGCVDRGMFGRQV